jgi:hypothetical protein
MNQTFIDILLTTNQAKKKKKKNKMTYSEIYKILSFEKTNLITTKLLCPQKII